MRIVSLLPSATEIVFALGLGDDLVGVTHECDYPLEAREKPVVTRSVHELVSASDRSFYFPAYELVIDVLRDYRFYDIDLVHPNYAATEFVFEKFTEYYIDRESISIMEEIRDLVKAFKHKPFQPGTLAHRKFMESYLFKARQLQQKYPSIDFGKEMLYFEKFSDGGDTDKPEGEG